VNALRKLVSVNMKDIRVKGYAIECVIDRMHILSKSAFECVSELVNASMNRCVIEGCCMLVSKLANE
jgi:hypothetical protein